MPKKTAPWKIKERLVHCVKPAILSHTIVFEGCLSVTQLVARVVYHLGYEPKVMLGRVKTFYGPVVTHMWVEMPELDLGIETNPSQILGFPLEDVPVMLVRLSYFDTFAAREEVDLDEIDFKCSPDGERFFGRLAKQIAKCVRQ